jgi:hypothetical protein
MLRCKNATFYLAVTRFNDATFKENQTFREKHNFEGCVYGVPTEITPSIPQYAKVFVLEMNNTKNKIMGVGFISNKLKNRKRNKIYSDQNYNRFSYVSRHRVDREEMTRDEKSVLKELETIIFKGKGHLKRGHGISKVPQKKIGEKKNDILKFLVGLFQYEDAEEETNTDDVNETDKASENIKANKSDDTTNVNVNKCTAN